MDFQNFSKITKNRSMQYYLFDNSKLFTPLSLLVTYVLANFKHLNILIFSVIFLRGENSVCSLGFGSVCCWTAPLILPGAGTEIAHEISETEKTTLNPPRAIVSSVWFCRNERRWATGMTGDRLEGGLVSHCDREAWLATRKD